MIRGRIDDDGNALLDVTVRGLLASAVFEGHLDTEFDGADLSLPADEALPLGLVLSAKMDFELATGETATEMVYMGFASIGGRGERPVAIILNRSDDTLISRQWLRGHSLHANYATGELVVQPETQPRQRTRRRRR